MIEELSFVATHHMFRYLAVPDTKLVMIESSKTYRILKSLLRDCPEAMKKETILIRRFGTSNYKNNFMFYLTEEVTQILVQAGIPQYLREFVADFYFPWRQEVIGPKVFGIEDLDFGFEIWLAACAVAIAVFIVEILSHKIKLFIQNVFGVRGLMSILKIQKFY